MTIPAGNEELIKQEASVADCDLSFPAMKVFISPLKDQLHPFESLTPVTET